MDLPADKLLVIDASNAVLVHIIEDLVGDIGTHSDLLRVHQKRDNVLQIGISRFTEIQMSRRNGSQFSKQPVVISHHLPTWLRY